jgi:hypothetical protein
MRVAWASFRSGYADEFVEFVDNMTANTKLSEPSLSLERWAADIAAEMAADGHHAVE